jgi:TonB family protein
VDFLNSAGTPLDAAPRRRTTMAASVLVHVAFVATIFYAAHNREWTIPARPSRALTFVSMLTPPEPARPIPPKPLRVPPLVKEAKIRETPPVELLRPIIERVVTRLEPAPPASEPRRDPIRPERPKPAPPMVTVGAFALIGNSPRAIELSRTTQGAGFDAPAARAPEMRVVSAATGAFEQSSAGRPQPGTDRPNVLGDAGFGSGVAAGHTRPAARVADAGFGTGTASAPAPRGGRGLADGGFDAGRTDARESVLPAQVKTTDFDTRAQQAAAQAPRQATTDVPLQIMSKPTPTYTDEARALEIEGEVLLDVEFTATGEIRVLKIVRGLGHGLDESATRAVQGMRFKPAQRNGQPIDIRTTVNIVFRLA